MALKWNWQRNGVFASIWFIINNSRYFRKRVHMGWRGFYSDFINASTWELREAFSGGLRFSPWLHKIRTSQRFHSTLILLFHRPPTMKMTWSCELFKYQKCRGVLVVVLSQVAQGRSFSKAIEPIGDLCRAPKLASRTTTLMESLSSSSNPPVGTSLVK